MSNLVQRIGSRLVLDLSSATGNTAYPLVSAQIVLLNICFRLLPHKFMNYHSLAFFANNAFYS
jgi:hypothetical protein